GHDEVLAERRLPHRLDLHARRRRGHGAEVRDDLPVVGELAVGANLEAGEFRRRRDLRGWSGGEEENQQDALHGARIIGAANRAAADVTRAAAPLPRSSATRASTE